MNKVLPALILSLLLVPSVKSQKPTDAETVSALSIWDLATYAGRWRSESGEIILLWPSGDKLTLDIKKDGRWVCLRLFAEVSDRLHDSESSFELIAQRDVTGQVIRLRRKIGDEETVFEKFPERRSQP